MDAASVIEIVAALEGAGVSAWLDGGWGVDALLGEETRAHGDLDLILADTDADALRRALAALGYAERTGGSATSFVLADARGREVDAHAVAFDARGYGSFALPDGGRWPFPPSAFAGRGRVAGREVRCLSAEAQVMCHAQGYEPKAKDLHDMQRLQDRFGVVLPLSLCRL